MPIEMIMEPASIDAEETLADSGFYWRESGGVKVLVCRPLEDAGFVNGFSTRLGGVSPFPDGDLNMAGYSEDTAENIAENRRRFLALFNGQWSLATVWQVHGNIIKAIRSDADIANSEEYADAVISSMSGVLAGVKTADCVPVLIGDPTVNVFAAVHAGWRGTVQSIVCKTVESLQENYGSNTQDLFCAIGPAASGRHYEIGRDVMDAFADNFDQSEKYFSATREGHALVDLHMANRDQLVDAGVKNENIYTAPYCTMERPDLFFSYRLEKRKYGKTGRSMSVIGRRG